MRTLVLTRGREIKVRESEYWTLKPYLDNRKENKDEMVDAGGEQFLIGEIKHVYKSGADPTSEEPYTEKVQRLFSYDESEYRLQAPVDKAKREYYGRFMNLIITAYGIRKVLGDDYRSPLLDVAYDHQNGEEFKFTQEQQDDRIARFEGYLLSIGRAREWGTDLKNFFVEYFNENPKATWCPLELWLPKIDVPTNRFTKILIAHDGAVARNHQS